MRSSKILMMVSTAIIGAGAPAIATAQPVNEIETIVVTARKTSEDLLKVPVAVSALTAKDIAARGIESIQDVAKFTPGLNTNQSIGGSLRSDRSFQHIIIRGMNPSSTANPTTSVFINGSPVGTSDFVQSLSDVERVEVLKGPQSAYFGRATFAGAVNIITPTAGDTLTGGVSATIGTRNTRNFTANLTVPIFADKFSVRGGYSYKSKDGSYKNAFKPSETLGDQRTESANLGFTLKPFENLTVKGFALAFRDTDGPPATGALFAAPGKSFDQGNCLVSGQPYFCGTLPGLLPNSPAQVTTVVAANNFANLSQTFLANPGGILDPEDRVNGFGLKRRAYHGDLSIQYEMPDLGLTATYLGAYNHNNWSEISDLANINGAANGQYPGYQGFPFSVTSKSHDYSHEFRLASDADKPLRGVIGVSYVKNYSQGALGVAGFGARGVNASPFNENENTGVFFGVAYDVLPQLTLNVEGRWQRSKEALFTAATHAPIANGTFEDFMPRVSVQYKFNPDVMAYVTYSQGVNTAAFNAQFSALPVVSQQKLQTLGLASSPAVSPEKLTNYEIGVKGRFLDGRATLSADIYYDEWTNQLLTSQYIWAANDPTNPYNVVGAAQYNPVNNSAFLYTFTGNFAASTAKGVEVEAKFIVFDHFTVNAAGAINDTKFDTYNCLGGCAPFPATTPVNTSGKYLPNASKNSLTLGVEYANDVSFLDDANWYIRTDYVYKSGVYFQANNTAKTPAINLVNVRAGLNWKGMTAEAYVDNLTNDDAYVSAFQGLNFAAGFTPSVVMVGLPNKITGGLKLSYRY